jgi:hypothetical protein
MVVHGIDPVIRVNPNLPTVSWAQPERPLREPADADTSGVELS